MKRLPFIWHLFLALIVPFGLSAQTDNSTFYLFPDGPTKVVRIQNVVELSTGDFLVAGEASSYNWLPTSVSPVILDTNGIGVQGSAPNFSGFIAQMSSDLSTVKALVRWPDQTIPEINKIKFTTPPGQPEGDMFISGGNGGGNYYIARMNNNFVSGVPTGARWLTNIKSGSINNGKGVFDGEQSWHAENEIWDVNSKGKVYAARGEEFSFDWAAINVLDPTTGEFTVEEGWNNHMRAVTNTNDTIQAHISPASAFPGTVLESALLFKTIRQVSLWSITQGAFDSLMVDENGNPGRKGKWPHDFTREEPCALRTAPGDIACLGMPFGSQTGYTGYKSASIYTARVGDIVVNKNTDEYYICATTPVDGPNENALPPAGAFDMEPSLMAFDSSGFLKWWARGHQEIDTNAVGGAANAPGSPADQFFNHLAIDYTHNEVVVVGQVVDTCTYNLWEGDQLVNKPGGKGVQNKFTGTSNSSNIAWIGRYSADSGKINHATYVGAYSSDYNPNGSYYLAPYLSHIKDFNTGNPDLADVSVKDVKVNTKGHVSLIGKASGRFSTTGRAYKMMVPDSFAISSNCFVPSKINFVRTYNSSLDTIEYSSLISMDWDYNSGMGFGLLEASAFEMVGDSNFLIAGYHQQPAGSELLDTTGQPAWTQGQSVAGFQTGFVLNLKMDRGADTVDWQNTPCAVSAQALIAEHQIKLYPNPAQDQVQVRLGAGFPAFERGHLVLRDILGRPVQRQALPSGQLEMSISLQDLPQGMYMVELNLDGRRGFKQLMVE